MAHWYDFALKAAPLLVMTCWHAAGAYAQPVKVDVSFSTSGVTEAHNAPPRVHHGDKTAQVEVSGQEKVPCSNMDAAKSKGSAYAAGDIVKKDEVSVALWLTASALARGGKYEQCSKCDNQFCSQPSGPVRTEGKAHSEARANVSYQFGPSVLTNSLKSFRLLITVLEANTDPSKLTFNVRRTSPTRVAVARPDEAFDFTPRPNEQLILEVGLRAEVKTDDATDTKQDDPRVKLRVDIAEAPVLEAAVKEGYILKGTVTTEHKSVGLLAIVNDAGIAQPHCTGTVVGNSAVLTAAHCVHSASVRSLITQGKLLFMVEPTPGEMLPIPIARFFIPAGEPPEKFKFNEKYDKSLEDDVAVLITDQPIGLPSVKLYEGSPAMDSIVKGKVKVTFVGYGLDPASSTETGAGIKRAAVLPLLQADNSTLLYTSAATGASTCHGDSGGPAFIENGGGLELAGITSYGSGNCRQGRSMRVDRYSGWIKARIN